MSPYNFSPYNFSVGDRIKIVDKGKAYSDNHHYATQLNATLWKKGGARKELNNGDKGRIESIIKTEWFIDIALVRVGDAQYIVGFEGLVPRTEEENDDRGKVVPFWD